MPAIQPVRLKSQAARLAETFSQPAAFSRGLKDLLEEYADHTHHHGKAGEPAPLLTAFKTPHPVLRQIWLEILPFISKQPQAAITLSDALWQQPYIEHRTIAADILGSLPLNYQKDVINRIQLWAREGIEDRLVDILLGRGLALLRSQSPQAITGLIEFWLSSKDQVDKQLGLRLLHSLVSDPSYSDLPVLFRLLNPYLRFTPPPLRPEIILILKAMIQRSAPEVAYLLRQNLTAADNPTTAWFIRQVITELPPDLQPGLRNDIRRK